MPEQTEPMVFQVMHACSHPAELKTGEYVSISLADGAAVAMRDIPPNMGALLGLIVDGDLRPVNITQSDAYAEISASLRPSPPPEPSRTLLRIA